MFIKIGQSWLFNTKYIKCIGIYANEPKDLVIEYRDGKYDKIPCEKKEDAQRLLHETMDTLGILYGDGVTSLPRIFDEGEEPAND